jgi:hypothetical protein
VSFVVDRFGVRHSAFGVRHFSFNSGTSLHPPRRPHPNRSEMQEVIIPVRLQKWIIRYPHWWASRLKRLMPGESCIVLVFSLN